MRLSFEPKDILFIQFLSNSLPFSTDPLVIWQCMANRVNQKMRLLSDAPGLRFRSTTELLILVDSVFKNETIDEST